MTADGWSSPASGWCRRSASEPSRTGTRSCRAAAASDPSRGSTRRISRRGSRARSRTSIRCASSRRKTSRRWTSSSSTRSRRRSSPIDDAGARGDAGDRAARRRVHRLGDRRVQHHRARAQGAARGRARARSRRSSFPSAIINLAAGQVSIRFGAKGPNSATCTACSASAHAIGDAYEIIRRDAADVMIAGGSEAAITPMGVGGFAAMRALSTRNDEPQRASRPFDKDRDGFIVGEGAGVLMLEEFEFAKRARRADLRRAGRLRHVGRRVSHHRAVRRRRRPVPRDERGDRERRASGRSRSTTSTPTAPRRRTATRSRRSPSSAASAITRARSRSRRPSR